MAHVTKGEPYDLIHNGDALDGVHHGSTNQISHNLATQAQIAYDVMAPRVEKARRYFHIRGTEAHVGKSGAEEERLAQRLGAVPDERGNHARWELFKRLGPALVHYLHHVGTTGSQAYESTALHKELVESYTEAARWGDEPPQVIVRSHRHRYLQTIMETAKGPAIAVVTPAWQLKTPFTYKIPGARLSQPQIGLIVLRVSDTGGKKVTATGESPVRVLSWVRRIERPQEV